MEAAGSVIWTTRTAVTAEATLMQKQYAQFTVVDLALERGGEKTIHTGGKSA